MNSAAAVVFFLLLGVGLGWVLFDTGVITFEDEVVALGEILLLCLDESSFDDFGDESLE